MERVLFDFSELRGLIIAKYNTCAAFAKEAGMSRAALSQRLNNSVSFQPDEMHRIASPELLDIPASEIGRYFLTPKV